MVKKTNILPNHTTNLYPDNKLEKLPPYKDYLYIFRGDENKGYGELSAFQALLSQKKMITEELSDAWRYVESNSFRGDVTSWNDERCSDYRDKGGPVLEGIPPSHVAVVCSIIWGKYGGSAFPLQPILDFLLTYGNPETNPL